MRARIMVLGNISFNVCRPLPPRKTNGVYVWTCSINFYYLVMIILKNSARHTSGELWSIFKRSFKNKVNQLREEEDPNV